MKAQNIKAVLPPDAKAFWRYLDSSQSLQETPDGTEADAEESSDLKLASAIEIFLTSTLTKVDYLQNWDWNDDKSRAVYVVRSAVTLSLVLNLQRLLVGEHADYRIVVMVHEKLESDFWAGLVIASDGLVIQQQLLPTLQVVY